MDIVIIITFLALLNFGIIKYTFNTRKKLIAAGVSVMLLVSPLVFMVTLLSISNYTGSGIAGGFAGFTYGTITFLNGLIYLIKGLTTKNEETTEES